jgi:hypothetical protein
MKSIEFFLYGVFWWRLYLANVYIYWHSERYIIWKVKTFTDDDNYW